MVRALLLGGPHSGRTMLVEPTVTIHSSVDGIDHTYTKGANLPDDAARRLHPDNRAFTLFGYAGPNEEYIAQLVSNFPPAPAEASDA